MKGFTLFELLVVLVIVALLSTIGVLSFKTRLPAPKTKQLWATRLEQAHQQAVLSQSLLGLGFAQSETGLFRYDGVKQRWHLLKKWAGVPQSVSASGDFPPDPQWLFYPNGETLTP